MDFKRALKQLKAMEENSTEMRLAAESWGSDYEILISTILSARTRDEVTIPVAEKLFKHYPNAKKLANAEINEIKDLIHPINFYKNKAKNIINCSKTLVENFSSKVPRNFDDLISLPGVGRKTANVFLAEMGGDNIGVDTHLNYVSNYLGWTRYKDPKKIEIDLKKLFPKKYWSKLNVIAVRFGKTYTSKRKKDEILEKIRSIK